MATFNKINQFVSDLCKGVHNFTSDATCSVRVALTASANAPVATNTILANLTEIAYTNLSARVITGITANQAAGTASITASNLVLTASGAVATFRYVAVYNDTPTSPNKPLIGWYDYGSDVTLANGDTFTISFSTTIATLA